MSIEIEGWFGQLGEKGCTKGAFSLARYRVLWPFFRDWNLHLVKQVYADGRDLLKWKGFYLKAVDGSTLYLFRDTAIEEAFGSQSNQFGSIPMARVGIELDVLNGYCTQAQLQPYSQGEGIFAAAFLENATPDELRIYDRYFASFELIFKHLFQNTHFLMRCKVSFNRTVSEFVASGKAEAVVDFPITPNAIVSLQGQGHPVDEKTTVRVRLLRIDIGQEEPEILITSLTDLKKYPYSEFKKRYNYRWGDETRFDQMKNKLQIEVFSGHKPEAVYQDFFTTVIVSNLQNLLSRECSEELQKVNSKRKTPAAINQNVSIGFLKPRLVKLFLTRSTTAIFEELKSLFLKNLEPIKRGRNFPRTKFVQRVKGKYRTFKNYRRAT